MPFVNNGSGGAKSGVSTVNGKSGNVLLTKQDVGLRNVADTEQATKDEFLLHAGDTNHHITEQERQSWNSKIDETHKATQLDVVTPINDSRYTTPKIVKEMINTHSASQPSGDGSSCTWENF